MLDNRYAILFIRGAKPVMDLKYDLTKHPAIRYTVDGGGVPYIHHQKKPQNWLSGSPLFTLKFENFNDKKEISVHEETEKFTDRPATET